jgi:uncharacterized protein (TIRG00374 family)
MTMGSWALTSLDISARLKNAGRRIGSGLFVAIGLAIVLALFFGGEEFLAYLRRFPPGLLALLLALSLVNYALRAWRWDVYARQRGIRIPFLRQLLYYVAGFALTVTPGKVGELVRLWLIREGEGQPYTRTLPLLFADRLADGLALLLMACIGLATLHAGILSAIVPASIFFLGIWWLGTRPRLVMGLAVRLQRRIGRGRAGLRKLRHVTHEVAGLLRSAPFLFGLVLSVLGWMAEAAALWWLLDSLGAPLSLLTVAFIFAVSMLAGAAAMLPGGLGGAEISMVALLVGFGVASEPSLIATALIRLTTLWFGVGLGFLVLPLALRSVGRRP